jgi:hypothetical protein
MIWLFIFALLQPIFDSLTAGMVFPKGGFVGNLEQSRHPEYFQFVATQVTGLTCHFFYRSYMGIGSGCGVGGGNTSGGAEPGSGFGPTGGTTSGSDPGCGSGSGAGLGSGWGIGGDGDLRFASGNKRCMSIRCHIRSSRRPFSIANSPAASVFGETIFYDD